MLFSSLSYVRQAFLKYWNTTTKRKLLTLQHQSTVKAKQQGTCDSVLLSFFCAQDLMQEKISARSTGRKACAFPLSVRTLLQIIHDSKPVGKWKGDWRTVRRQGGAKQGRRGQEGQGQGDWAQKGGISSASTAVILTTLSDSVLWLFSCYRSEQTFGEVETYPGKISTTASTIECSSHHFDIAALTVGCVDLVDRIRLEDS